MPLKDGGCGFPQPYDEKTGKYTTSGNSRDYDKEIAELKEKSKGLSLFNPQRREYYKQIEQLEAEKTDKLAFEIMKNGETINGEDSEDADMEAEQIRNLLKLYGAEDKEIENFMKDLYETKDEMKDEEEDFNYLDGDTMAKLKATKEGQDLIINAPKMAKDELKKAIMEYLSKQS